MPAKPRAPRRSRASSQSRQPDFPLVYVKFHDHCWVDAKELKKIQVAKPFVIEETGFLLQQNEKFITVAKERSTDGEKGKTQYDDVTIIMRSDIISLEVFRKGSSGSR